MSINSNPARERAICPTAETLLALLKHRMRAVPWPSDP